MVDVDEGEKKADAPPTRAAAAQINIPSNLLIVVVYLCITTGVIIGRQDVLED